MSSTPEQRSPPEIAAPATVPDTAATSNAQRLWWTLIAALFLGYAALSHYSASTPDARWLGAALSLGPVILVAVALLWRWAHPAVAILVAALLGALMYVYWAAFEQNYEWSDLVQQCGIYALVAASFARSLFGARVPLCTQFAAKMHGELSDAEVSYTRGATWAWAIFYAMLTVATLVLFFAVPLRVWSLFITFGTFALIVIAGIVDHAIRRRRLPRHADGGLIGVIRRSLIG
jgi:uncharacterized membrane protein